MADVIGGGPGPFGPIRVCGQCAAPITVVDAVVFEVSASAVLAGPDAPIVSMRAGPTFCCGRCAALVAARDVRGLVDVMAAVLAQEPDPRDVDGLRSEMSALVMRFLDVVGSPLSFAEWWARRSPGDAGGG